MVRRKDSLKVANQVPGKRLFIDKMDKYSALIYHGYLKAKLYMNIVLNLYII